VTARNEELIILIESLRNTLTSHSTGGGGDSLVYAKGRQALLDDPSLAAITPRWLKSCRNLSDFWGMI
jgi:hypothetical protein